MNSIGIVLAAIKSGFEFRHDNNWIFAAELAGKCDRREYLADICRRLAQECNEASRLGVRRRVGKHVC